MPRSVDLRKQVGTRVHARARLVTSESDCKRFFGTLWKTKLVTGTTTAVNTNVTNGRKQTIVTVNFELPGRFKECDMKLCSLKVGDHVSVANQQESGQSVTIAQNAEVCTDNITVEAVQASNVTSNDAVTEEHSTQEPDAQPGPEDDVVSAHSMNWKSQDVPLNLNGSVQMHRWKIIGPAGDFISQSHAPSGLTPYDFFMWMFPVSHLSTMVFATNQRLSRHGLKETTGGEILRFFGVMILVSRFQFSDRRSLWSSQSYSEFIEPPKLGKAIGRNRFEILRRFLVFSEDSDDEVEDEARWSLVTGFLKAINNHRRAFVTPGSTLCVDESMSRWYGLGGDWIGVGLPHYVALERKPENGCELKNVCCGKTGIMLNAEISMGSSVESDLEFTKDNAHGTSVLMRLVQDWFGTDRLVCADSYFASVDTAVKLLEKGLRFIGVIKTATRKFPMKHLSELTMTQRGEHYSMVSNVPDSDQRVMAVLWVDRDRRYFFSTYGSTNPGTPISRDRWRMVNGKCKKVSLSIPIPEVCESYYECCSKIDRHNRCRQDDLNLEKKFEVKEWSFRINTSLFAICVVDAWNLYKCSIGDRKPLTPHHFYCQLADQLIKNNWDSKKLVTRVCEDSDKENADPKRAGTGIHLMQTNRKRMKKDGTLTAATYQGRCKVCKSTFKSKFICSKCLQNKKEQVYICHSLTGRVCFLNHLRDCHSVVDMDW